MSRCLSQDTTTSKLLPNCQPHFQHGHLPNHRHWYIWTHFLSDNFTSDYLSRSKPLHVKVNPGASCSSIHHPTSAKPSPSISQNQEP